MLRCLVRRARGLALTIVTFVLATSGACWLFGARIVSHLKPAIEELASGATGLRVSFASGTLRLFPALAVTLRGGVAAAPDGCSQWQLDEASAYLELAALLQGRIDVHSIDLSGVRGTLAASGGRIQMARPDGTPCAPPPSAQNPAQAASHRPGPTWALTPLGRFTLDIRDLELSGIEVQLFRGEQKYQLSLRSLKTGLLFEERATTLPSLVLVGAVDAVPIGAEIQRLSLSPDAVLSLSSANVQVGDHSVQASGSYNLNSRAGTATISAHEIALATSLGPLLGTSAPLSGTARGSLEIALQGADATISGKASLSGLALTNGGTFKLHEGELDSLSVIVKEGALSSAESHLSLREFNCTADGDSYSVERAEGRARIVQDAGLSLSGELAVEGFGFADSDTKISRASARLREISGAVTPAGDVDIRLNLDASSIYLTNPNVIISSVQHVTAPIDIRVPSKGGYSVSGPVTIAGGVLSLSGRTLERTGGRIEMLVSSPLKDFRSTSLGATSHTELIGASTHFAMTHESYILKDTSFRLGNGSLATDLSLGRRGERPLTIGLQATALPLPAAYRAVAQRDDPPLRGTLASLKANVSGSRQDLPGSLSGGGSLLVTNGVFTTFDLQGSIRSAISAIPLVGTKLVPSLPPNDIQDGSISSTFTIGRGAASLPDLKIQFSNMTVEAALAPSFSGAIEGKASVIFMEQTFRMLGLGFDALGNFLAREGRIAIPLTIGNTVSSPSVTPDMAEIRKFITGQDLLEDIESGVQALRDDV